MKSLFTNIRLARDSRIGVSQFALWRPDVKVRQALVGPFISMGRLVLGSLSRSWVVQIHAFTNSCVTIARKSGVRGLVLYLKTAHVCLMQSLPGSELRFSSRDIGKVAVARSRDGLPRIIPRGSRALIRKGHKGAIRLWMTLLSVYRALPMKGKAKWDTITAPGVNLSPEYISEFRGFIRKDFLPMLEKFSGEALRDLDPAAVMKPEPLGIRKASSDSPFTRRATDGFKVTERLSSFGTRKVSARCWIEGKWGDSLEQYLWFLDQCGKTNTLWDWMADSAGWSPPRAVTPPNGRLHCIEEPAGKVRVVAMVDYWTQVALYPLHKFLFNILRDVDQDGTFDQHRPVKALLKKASMSQRIYSYDLSAATDRLPISLQEVILSEVFTPDFGEAWRELLVGREYRRPKGYGPPVKYAVGQPMGAYSSWAMLAWTHHAIVQWCARRVGHEGWFKSYAVLGDDIVISDDKVAEAYVRVCKEIGLGIGLAKSLVSTRRTCEFAKTLFFEGDNVSGLPMLLWNAARTSFGVAGAMLERITSQNPITLATFATACGVGYRSASKLGNKWNKIPRRLRVMAVMVTHPAVKSSLSRKNWLEWLVQEGPTLPVKEATGLHWFLPWATGLLNEVVAPAQRAVEEKSSVLYFSQGPRDTWGRLYEATVNSHIVRGTESLDKAMKSLQHLQSLHVKFMMHQAGAVLQQVTAVAERWAMVPEIASRAERAQEDDFKAIALIPLYAKWLKIRRWSEVRCTGLSAAERLTERLSPVEDQVEQDDLSGSD